MVNLYIFLKRVYYLIIVEIFRPLGQPYFLTGVQEANKANAITATTGTKRRRDKNIFIKNTDLIKN